MSYYNNVREYFIEKILEQSKKNKSPPTLFAALRAIGGLDCLRQGYGSRSSPGEPEFELLDRGPGGDLEFGYWFVRHEPWRKMN